MHPPMKTDPLGPIDAILTALTGLVLAFCLLAVGFGVFADFSVWGINNDSPSVETRIGVMEWGGSDEATTTGLRDSATDHPATLRIVDSDPTTRQRLAITLPGVGALLWLIGLLVLGRTAIRRARRHGPFTPATATWTQLVAWWLLLAAPLVGLGHSFGTAVFLDEAVTGGVDLGGMTLSNLDFPWTQVIAGAAVLTFSRLLRQAGDLQEEVDLTV